MWTLRSNVRGWEPGSGARLPGLEGITYRRKVLRKLLNCSVKQSPHLWKRGQGCLSYSIALRIKSLNKCKPLRTVLANQPYHCGLAFFLCVSHFHPSRALTTDMLMGWWGSSCWMAWVHVSFQYWFWNSHVHWIPPEGLLKHRSWEPHPQSFWFSRSGWGLRCGISNKFPDGVDAADPETTLLRTTGM